MYFEDKQKPAQDDMEFVAAVTNKVTKRKALRLYILAFALLSASLIFGFITTAFVDTDTGISSALIGAVSVIANPVFLEEWLWLFISLVLMYSSGTPD